MIEFLKRKDLPDFFEIVSECCGAPMYPDVPGLCGQCRDWSGFVAIDEDGNELGNVDPSEW